MNYMYLFVCLFVFFFFFFFKSFRSKDGVRNLELGAKVFKKKKKFEISNKHPFSINKLSTNKKIQNYCFLIQYNVIIYEKRTWHFFKSLKPFLIEPVLNVATISLLINNIIAFAKNLFSILLQMSTLVTFLIKNVHSIVVVETKRVSRSL